MFRKTTLQSGLRVVTEKLEGTKAVTVLVLAGAGSRYETQEIRGISHFLEHMFFKGAKKYKNTKEVSEAIDSVGGMFNAFTGKEYAGYYVKVASENLEVACDVLSDMLVRATFPQEEIEKERGVILEEYNMYQDTPMYQIGWNFESLIFGDQPLGWDQIGTKELIKTVNNEDFVKYRNELYTPDNIVVAISGNIAHEKAVEMVQKYFQMEEATKAYNYVPVKIMEGKAGSFD
jgi:predicted Zn-dependent peptidase